MYDDINDNDLLDKVSDNELATEALFKKYKPLIYSISKRAFYANQSSGLELNDLIQEGMIGFSVALNTYDDSKDASFFTFARMCITRRIISSINSYNRLKHQALNESVSVDGLFSESKDIERVFSDYESNPENILLSFENIKELIYNIKSELTVFEGEVFELKAAGFNYKEIADILDKTPKSIDNAISRIKQKISSYLEENKK